MKKACQEGQHGQMSNASGGSRKLKMRSLTIGFSKVEVVSGTKANLVVWYG